MIRLYNLKSKECFDWSEIILKDIEDCPNSKFKEEIKNALNNLEKEFTESNFREVITLLNSLKNTNVVIQNIIAIPRTIYVEDGDGNKALFQV